MENVKVVGVRVEPVSGNVNPEDLRKTVEATAQAVKETLNGFSDEVPTEESEESKARNFLNMFTSYIKGESFKKDINETAKKYGIPPKKLAENFFEKALGTVGDVLGIAIGTVGNAGHTLIDILATIAHGAVNVIISVANALARMITFNKTCIA